MLVITKEYDLVWELSYAPNYQFDEQLNCINIKTGRFIKETVVGYTVGYCINSKFTSKTRLKQSLVRIEKQDCPF